MNNSRNWWRAGELETEKGGPSSHAEFAPLASEWGDGLSRRDFLRLMSASLALGGLNGCTRQPIEEIVPFVHEPERMVPGEPLFYATAMELNGYAAGLLVEAREGRPIKIEGNPEHPMSLGGSSAFHQASLLELYNPDRSIAMMQAGEISSWEGFLGDLNGVLQAQRAKGGSGLRILTEATSSPTLIGQLEAVRQKFPGAKWLQFEPLNRDAVYEGARRAFGEELETQYDFEKAEVILALDSDFLFSHPAGLRYTRQFAAARRRGTQDAKMPRLYAAESSLTITGSMADARLPLASAQIAGLAWRIANRISGNEAADRENLEVDRWVELVVADLRRCRGSSIVIAGERQPAAVHFLCHQINQALGNAGTTVTYGELPTLNLAKQTEGLSRLVQEMNRGVVDALILIGGNPVFNAPADLAFGEALMKVNWRAHLSLFEDETSALCHWHIPRAHFLESWSDTRGFDGTASIVQPLIEPLYGGKTAHDVFEAILSPTARSSYEIVRAHWAGRKLWPNFEKGWRKALHDGAIPETNTAPRSPRIQSGIGPRPAEIPASGLEINFRPDPSVWDGRFADNAWLQELPRPISKLTWDNAALISDSLASRYQLRNGQMVELEYRGRTVRLPVWIMPGQASDSVTLHLGYGRAHAGRVGKGVGFDVYALRPSDTPSFGHGLRLTKTSQHHRLATTQEQHGIEGRDVFRSVHVADRQKLAPEAENGTLYNPDEFKNSAPAWGMVIDLNACVGCNACVTACYAENNIPVVGKDQVARGRIMQWIRVDAYFSGRVENPEVGHQPVPCMHCENAPCELVCPVGATVHDSSGLNLQVYNRCIGTRFCSNNCPYKVRRFNFLQYSDTKSPTLKMMRNPEVTVRSRGVMEKCTYCVQRISRARIQAEKEVRPIHDEEIVPACAQACPAEAIVFGDTENPESKVSKLKKGPLNYGMLAELNTRPRTTYLARLTNPPLDEAK